MKTINRYAINPFVSEIVIPKDAKILTVHEYEFKVCIWGRG